MINVESLRSKIGNYPEIQEKTCGLSKGIQSRIINGSDAQIEEYPWMAYVEIQQNQSETRRICGAAIIHGYWLLTAAECVCFL